MLFATHSKNPESDFHRMTQAVKHISIYPSNIKSMLDIKEMLIESQPSTSAYTIQLIGPWRFESDEMGLGKKVNEVSNVNRPQATYTWNLSIFDPRASAVPGDHIDTPVSLVNARMAFAFHASPESTRALPRFAIEFIRQYPALGRLLRDQKVPFASSINVAQFWVSGVLEDGISSFPKHTIALPYYDTDTIKHARWPKFIEDILEEVDIGLAHLGPTVDFDDGPRRLHEHLCRELPHMLDGGYPDLLEIRMSHANQQRQAFYQDPVIVQTRRRSTSKPQSSPRMQGARRFSTASTRPASSAFIALGSNMGDRLGNMDAACRELASEPKIKLRRTSGLWQTKAMYVVDQDDFLNGVCEVR